MTSPPLPDPVTGSARSYLHPDYLIESAHENLPPTVAKLDLMSIADERGMVKTGELLAPLFTAWGRDPSPILPYPVLDPWWRETLARTTLDAFGGQRLSIDAATFSDGSYEIWKDLAGFVLRKGTMLGAGPIYPEFATWWQAAGGRFRPIVPPDLRFPKRELLDAIATDPAVTVIYADTPFNSTGEWPDRQGFLEVVEAAANRGIVVVADEAYANFLGPEVTWIPDVVDHPNLVIMRSLSKAYDLRGLRFAFAVAGSWVAPVLAQLRTPYAPSQVGAQCGLKILREGLQLVVPLRSAVRMAKAQVLPWLTKAGFQIRASHCDAPNFMFGLAGQDLATLFASMGVRVARGTQFAPTCGRTCALDVRIRVPLAPPRLKLLRDLLESRTWTRSTT